MSPTFTYPPEFETAVAALLADEGGYVSNPNDPGGETKFGISKRQYPDLDIQNLSRDQAIAIYFRDYWLKFHFDRLAPHIAAKLFDLGVDIGPATAIKLLQTVLANCGHVVARDGILGDETVKAAAAMPAEWLLTEIRVAAAHHYRVLAWADRKNDEFLKGWLRRAYA